MSARKTTWRDWSVKFQQQRMLGRLDRRLDHMGGVSGGQWNGRVAPSPPALLKDVWNWRALILEVAFQKTIVRYRSFVLGPLWIILGFGIFALGLSALWSVIQHVPFAVFVTYVSVGLLAWNIVLGVTGDGSRVLHENRNLIHQSKAPLLVYPLVTLLKHLFMAAHNLIVVVPILILFNPSFDLQLLWLIPGAVCLVLFCVSVCITLAIVGAYLPDLAEIISSLLRFAFFFTPIFWMPDQRPSLHLVWLLNPFYYAVESVRGPILHTSDPAFVIGIFSAFTLVAMLVAAVTFARWSRGARTRV